MDIISDLKKTHKKTDYAALYSKVLKSDLTMDEKALVAKILKTLALKKINIPFVISSNYWYIDLNEKDTNDNF